jgi:hypothetical protein
MLQISSLHEQRYIPHSLGKRQGYRLSERTAFNATVARVAYQALATIFKLVNGFISCNVGRFP